MAHFSLDWHTSVDRHMALLETDAILAAPFDCSGIAGFCRFAIPLRSGPHVPLNANPLGKAIRVKEHADGIAFFRTLPEEIRAGLGIALHAFTVHIEHAEIRQ